MRNEPEIILLLLISCSRFYSYSSSNFLQYFWDFFLKVSLYTCNLLCLHLTFVNFWPKMLKNVLQFTNIWNVTNFYHFYNKQYPNSLFRQNNCKLDSVTANISPPGRQHMFEQTFFSHLFTGSLVETDTESVCLLS